MAFMESLTMTGKVFQYQELASMAGRPQRIESGEGGLVQETITSPPLWVLAKTKFHQLAAVDPQSRVVPPMGFLIMFHWTERLALWESHPCHTRAARRIRKE